MLFAAFEIGESVIFEMLALFVKLFFFREK